MIESVRVLGQCCYLSVRQLCIPFSNQCAGFRSWLLPFLFAFLLYPSCSLKVLFRSKKNGNFYTSNKNSDKLVIYDSRTTLNYGSNQFLFIYHSCISTLNNVEGANGFRIYEDSGIRFPVWFVWCSSPPFLIKWSFVKLRPSVGMSDFPSFSSKFFVPSFRGIIRKVEWWDSYDFLWNWFHSWGKMMSPNQC